MEPGSHSRTRTAGPILLHLAAMTALIITSAGASDWPQYRGPARAGVVDEPELLAAWSDGGPRELWRRPVGTGYSAVTAAGERLYTMEADGEAEAVLCLDAATGETLWRVVVGNFVQAELRDGGPRSTPAVDGGTVYAASSQAKLVALAAADGSLRWERDLQEWGPVPRFGYAVSPLVDGGLVILEVGKPGEGPGVAAFDQRTGELRWTALDGPAGYSSPIVAEIAGVRQYVFSRSQEVVALSTAGELLWRHATERRSAIPMPVFLAPDRIFVATADDAFGGRVIRVVREGGAFRTEEVWQERLMRNHFNTSVLVDGHLYGFDNGTFRCLDAATGERLWAQRGFGKGSLIASGDLLFVLGDGGTLALVRASPEGYGELGRVQASQGRAWTAPTLANGRIYVRDFDELVSFDVRGDAIRTAGEAADGSAEGGEVAW